MTNWTKAITGMQIVSVQIFGPSQDRIPELSRRLQKEGFIYLGADDSAGVPAFLALGHFQKWQVPADFGTDDATLRRIKKMGPDKIIFKIRDLGGGGYYYSVLTKAGKIIGLDSGVNLHWLLSI